MKTTPLPGLPAVLALALLILIPALPAQAGMAVQAWGGLGKERKEGVDLYILTNKRGMEVRITNYGAVITSIKVPGRDGTMANVNLGFSSLAEYTSTGYSGRYGAIIGRFAGRIRNNKFRINNIGYQIDRNAYTAANNSTTNRPYDERVWTVDDTDDTDEPTLTLSLSDAGNMGFPGNVRVRVVYTLTKDNVLRIAYRATTNKPTVISLTNHAYFNMAGDTSGSVLDQLLTVNADAITAVDETATPTGVMTPVAGTGFDFRRPTPISAHINDPEPTIKRAGGIDHNYAIRGEPGTLRFAARLEDPKSGRVMEEWTTMPGLQVYTANYSPPPVGVAKGYNIHGGVALEAQGFPNAPNIPSFPSTLLVPDRAYDEVTEYRFSAK